MKDTLLINPKTSTLLVLDIQEIILDGSAGPPSAAEKEKKVFVRTAAVVTSGVVLEALGRPAGAVA
jgi:hypothetical protein